MQVLKQAGARWADGFSLIESLIALMLLMSITALILSAFSGISKKITTAVEAQKAYKKLMEAYHVVQGYANRACPPFWLKEPTTKITGKSVELNYIDGVQDARMRIEWKPSMVSVWEADEKKEEMAVPSYEVNVYQPKKPSVARAREHSSKAGFVIELGRGDTSMRLLVQLPCYSLFKDVL